MTIPEIYETWVNGNTSDVKCEVKKMQKDKFLSFVEYCYFHGITFKKIASLLDQY